MNNKATGKKPLPVKDHEKISQPMKIRRGETINFVGNTTLTRVNSTGQKNVAVDKSARPVDHGNETRPKVSSVRTAYKSAARLFSQGSSNAHTPVAPKEVPKESNFTQTNCAKARPGQKALTKGPIISQAPLFEKFKVDKSKSNATNSIEVICEVIDIDLEDNDSNANAKPSAPGKKYFGYKSAARLFSQGSSNAQTPVVPKDAPKKPPILADVKKVQRGPSSSAVVPKNVPNKEQILANAKKPIQKVFLTKDKVLMKQGSNISKSSSKPLQVQPFGCDICKNAKKYWQFSTKKALITHISSMHKEPILLFDSKSKTIVSNVNRTPENSKFTEPRKPVQTLQSPPKVTSPCEEWSEMQKAVFQGDGEEVKKIIDDSEIGINAPVAEGLPLAGWTPIQIATLKGHANVIEILAEMADPDAPTPCKWTPLQIAFHYKYLDVLQILALIAKDHNIVNPLGWTPIQTAAKFGFVDCLNILLPVTKNPNMPNHFNWTPLQLAGLGGHTEAVKLLAPFAKNPNAPNPDGWTPIHLAARDGHNDIVEFLIPRSKIPNAASPDGWTPIQLAAKNGHTKIIEMLAPHTENVNAPTPEGHTPLQVAVCKGHVEVVKFLVSIIENPNEPDISGLTPVQSAINEGHWEVVKIFALFADNQEAKEALGWIFNDEITNVFNDDDQNDNNCKRKRENGNNELTAAKKFKLEEHTPTVMEKELQNNNDNKEDIGCMIQNESEDQTNHNQNEITGEIIGEIAGEIIGEIIVEITDAEIVKEITVESFDYKRKREDSNNDDEVVTAKKSKLFWQKMEQNSKDNKEENKSSVGVAGILVGDNKLEEILDPKKPSDAFEENEEGLDDFQLLLNTENDVDDMTNLDNLKIDSWDEEF